MKHVIKSLAGRRLIPQRKVFFEITTGLFVYLVKLWNGHLQEGVAQLSRGEESAALATLEMGHVCLKSEWSGEEVVSKIDSIPLQFCVR